MAKKGLRYFQYAVLNEVADTDTYGEVTSLGLAVKCDVTTNKNGGKFVCEDGEHVELDEGFSNASISVEQDYLAPKVKSEILGHAISEDGVITYDGSDVAPYLGFGMVDVQQKDNKLKYTAKFYPKVKFGEPNDNDATQGETTTFSSIPLEGTAVKNREGKFKLEKECISYADAKAFINECFVQAETTGE